mmetsp:Transcript_37206/g.69506  ORF Transcript_37206/g.69506 Transcript_37206/m.69506 type:complete len:247 (+) Transcript_37206:88-828(+)
MICRRCFNLRRLDRRCFHSVLRKVITLLLRDLVAVAIRCRVLSPKLNLYWLHGICLLLLCFAPHPSRIFNNTLEATWRRATPTPWRGKICSSRWVAWQRFPIALASTEVGHPGFHLLHRPPVSFSSVGTCHWNRSHQYPAFVLSLCGYRWLLLQNWIHKFWNQFSVRCLRLRHKPKSTAVCVGRLLSSGLRWELIVQLCLFQIFSAPVPELLHTRQVVFIHLTSPQSTLNLCMHVLQFHKACMRQW